MALFFVPGRGLVDDQEEGASIPTYGELTLPSGQVISWGDKGVYQLPQYTNTWQFSEDPFQWDPQQYAAGQGPSGSYNVGYIPQLIDWSDAARAGTLQPYEQEQYAQMVQAARAIPTRDLSQLQAGYPGDEGDYSRYLTPASPDAGAIMLQLYDKIQGGQATEQERGLYDSFLAQMREQNFRASVPQPSDVAFGLGDQLTGALLTLALGATGGLAAAPLAAGGAGLATTLGSLGTLSGIAGTGAGILGGATGQDWLSKLGLGLGIAGGLAGGVGGLANLWGTGIGSVGDAARLASSAGKVTGALGRIPGADPLKQASRYLGLAGGLGQGASGVQGLLGAAQGVQQGATQAATQALTDTGGRMAWGDDWLNWSGDMGGVLASNAAPTMDWGAFTAGGPGSWFGQEVTDWANGGGGGSLLSTLGSAAGAVGKWLGSNAAVLGPAASALGSLGGGLLGSRASSDAAAVQAAALNRGLDLQTAQWLQTQANQAPWLAAGQSALGDMLGRAQWSGPQQPGATPAVSGANYALPSATPGWTPQTYAGYTPGAVPQASQYGYQGPGVPQAGDYRWTPGQGPRAQDYRYTPGQIPGAADYRYTPGAVPTLSGAALLANDPGVQFRLDRARHALEGSAAARGSALSGPALLALQEQGQDLASQEYGNAWQRAAQQAQMREGWAQTASQMGFGQAMSEAQLREQVNQIATQQGWSQAQAEAAFREQLAQQASQQGYAQALQGQGQQWQQGLAGQQFNWQRAMQEAQQRAQEQQFGWQAGLQGQQAGSQEQQAWWNQLYGNQMQQSQVGYGRDVYANETDYQRQQAAYQQQIAELTRQWNQFASLSGTGQVSAGQLGQFGQANAAQQASLLGQLGSAQGIGTLGSAYNLNQAIGGGTTAFGNLLKGLNA